jgi:UDP-glucose 4-epimerase
VFHLAAAVGVELVCECPVDTIRTNVAGTEIVLESALRHNSKVVLASTSEVYGRGASDPDRRFSETDDITLGSSRRWCYAASKALDEHLALAYHRKSGLPVVVCRFFNTVGPRQSSSYGMVVPTFVEAALKGDPIRVYGDGGQSRSFTWVGDAADALIALARIPEAIGGIFNIGTDEKVTIGELAHKVKELTGSASEIVLVPYEEAYGEGFEDIRYRQPDISRLREVIGYEPGFRLDDILERVVEHTRERQCVPLPV